MCLGISYFMLEQILQEIHLFLILLQKVQLQLHMLQVRHIILKHDQINNLRYLNHVIQLQHNLRFMLKLII